MDVVVLHCHFERGGVTQVVENHVRALAETSSGDDRVFLFSSSRRGGLSPQTESSTTALTLDPFDYDTKSFSCQKNAERAKRLADEIQRQLTAAGIQRTNAILHWHNHSLGKNTAAPAVAAELAQRGWRLLLQVHDFAEDNRPSNYAGLIRSIGATSPSELDASLYPVANQIHYATLTGGDANVLERLGVPSDQVHSLPNCVSLTGTQSNDQEAALDKVRRLFNLPDNARWYLYPVRGIRRKNVGEFLLLTRWLPEHAYGALTLRPTTDVEARSYERWQSLAKSVVPNLIFDAGSNPDLSFMENLTAADAILSTSVAEGFGMAFLEPWLAGRPVVARELAGVTDDFRSAGVTMDSLYEAIPVPGDSSWLESCRAEYRHARDQAWDVIPRGFHPNSSDDSLGDSTLIDFAALTPARQQEVLERVATDDGFNNEMRSHSETLINNLHNPPTCETIAKNASVIGDVYSTNLQGQQLRGIYQQLLEASCDSNIEAPQNAGMAVNLVSEMKPFYPCRTETLT